MGGAGGGGSDGRPEGDTWGLSVVSAGFSSGDGGCWRYEGLSVAAGGRGAARLLRRAVRGLAVSTASALYQ